MRRFLVVIIGLLMAGLSSVIVGEYELVGATPILAGAILGGLFGELFLALGRWRGLIPGLIAAILTAGSMYWTGQINSNFGIDPYPQGAYMAAGVGSLVAFVRIWRAKSH